jgi:hypothetical protein
MKYVFFIVVALSTFFIGCVLARLHLGGVNSVPSASVVKVHLEKRALLEGIEPTVRACGDGYSQGYELPNGKKLAEGNACYSSFKQARKELDTWLKTADRIIDKSAPSRLNSNSRGERIVASFPKDEFGNEWVRIMWVDGQCIHWIGAPTLEHALEFESSKLNPYKFEE